MTKPKTHQDFWEQLWSKTLREHADKVAHLPPSTLHPPPSARRRRTGVDAVIRARGRLDENV